MNRIRRSGGPKINKGYPSPSIHDPLAKSLLGISAWVAFLTFLLGLPLLIMRVKFPMQIGQGEAINVEFALTLLRGGHLYGSPAQAPYLYTAYPPLFPWLQSWLIPAFKNSWLPGRLLAFSGYLGCGLLLAGWGVRRWGWEMALFLGSVFGLFQTWALWGTMVRVDALSLFFQFAAFLLLYRLETSATPRIGKIDHRGIILAGFLSAISILLKQDALVMVLVYTIYCLPNRSWNKLACFLIPSTILLAVVFSWQQEASGGFFLKYLFLWLDTGVRWENFRYYLIHFFLREAGIVLFLFLFLTLLKKTNRLLQIQILASLFFILGLARSMSAENYLMSFLLFGTFAIGEYWAAPTSDWAARVFGRWGRTDHPFGWLLLLILFWASTVTMRWPDLPTDAEIKMKFNAMEQFKKTGDDLALDMDLLVMAGKPIWVQPAEYKAMVDKGTWDLGPLLRDIRTKKFSTIELYDIPEQFLLPKLVVEEIGRNYHPFLHEYGRVWMSPNAS